MKTLKSNNWKNKGLKTLNMSCYCLQQLLKRPENFVSYVEK